MKALSRSGEAKADTLPQETIAQVLAFLPQIQAEVCDCATLQALINTLHTAKFVFRFDWPQWIAEAERYTKTPELLAHANVLTLRKLMTVYISRDHFAPGYLEQMLEAGILLEMLQRLARLNDAAAGKESADTMLSALCCKCCAVVNCEHSCHRSSRGHQ